MDSPVLHMAMFLVTPNIFVVTPDIFVVTPGIFFVTLDMVLSHSLSY